MARNTDDEVSLAHTLSHAIWAIAAPDTLDQRQLLIDELLDLTRRLDDPRLLSFYGWLAPALPRASRSGIARRSSLLWRRDAPRPPPCPRPASAGPGWWPRRPGAL